MNKLKTNISSTINKLIKKNNIYNKCHLIDVKAALEEGLIIYKFCISCDDFDTSVVGQQCTKYLNGPSMKKTYVLVFITIVPKKWHIERLVHSNVPNKI